ncbi:MAG: flagellar hook-associated protein 3 [Spirochaetota bacterium]
MRITNQIMNNTLVNNLNRHQSELDTVENQLATGMKLKRPSDEPGLATNQMYFRSRIHELGQYSRNVNDGKNRLQLTDSNMERVTEIVQRVRYLTVQASNGVYQGDNGFELEVAIGKEIDQHLRALVDIANTRDATGQYLFGGHEVEKAPFVAIDSAKKGLKGTEIQNQIVGVQYRGDTGEQLREIERGEYIGVTTPGNKAFWASNMSITSGINNSNYQATSDSKFKIDGVEIHVSAGDTVDDIIDKINNSPAEVKASKLGDDNISLITTTPHQLWLEDVGEGTVLKDLGILDADNTNAPNEYSSTATVTGLSMFDVLIQLKEDLTNKDQERISGRDLKNIDLALENVLRHRSEVGAKMNRLDEHTKRIEFDKTYMTEILAKNEGIDFPETIMNLKWLQSVHQYALSVGSKVIKPTLIDFLR